jgi:amino acid adenylation domain-containing protein
MKEQGTKMKNLDKIDHALWPHEEYAAFVAEHIVSQEERPYEKACIHQFVEAQVERTPDAPALVVKGEIWSYAQLNRQANQLAHRLCLLGVGPEVLVGLCLPRTADLLIALLAILKAGGAYVPLDPAYPVDRLRFQIQDSGAHLLLTISSLEHLWQGIEATRLYLDQIGEADNSLWDANLESNVNKDHLAYVMYTSGSTGLPKGVCIAHRNTIALIRWALRNYTLEDVRGMVAGTSVCFDLSIFEIFVPWSCGGTVYLVENGLHLPEGEAREQVTLLNMVPSVMAELARTTAIPASVRVITFCGETLPRPLVERLYKLPGVQRIYNLYGPTEDTTYSTWSLLDRNEHSENVPIGYPLDGSQVYLLDQDGQQVPEGSIGEIYLGGAGVTRGYWKRPEMTAQRFLTDPFSQQPGARLYRTGDLARYRSDGQLEFLGRIDQQVKIRGHRIELGEIESVLCQHAEVQEGVVLARKPASSSDYLILVAYVAPVRQHKNLEDELLAFLKQHLPEYMLPTFFVFLETLPKTSNGKIDRKALPDPQAGKERKPTHPSQMKHTGILNASAGRKELFKKLLKKESSSTSTPLLPETDKGPSLLETEKEQKLFPLSFMQQRYWLIDQLDPGTPLYNIFFASRITGNLDVEALTRSLHEIVRRHEPLRSAFFKVDGTPMQQVCAPANFSIPLVDLRSMSLEQQQEEEQRYLLQEPLYSFDIRKDILLRAKLLQSTDTKFVLMITMHHVSCDGWSIDVLREELGALYEAFSQGHPSPLPNLPIRYVDYVLWQHRRLQGSLLEQQLSYWKHQLANLPGPLHLPTDRPRSARQTFNGDSYRFTLPPALFRGLQGLAQNEGVTLFMTIFATFQVLLCRLSGQEDILVGTPIANRTQAELEKLIGCFVNTIVFRADMESNPSFRTLLQRVRTMALGAYSHQDVSFEQVLHVVRPERDSAYAYSPLFQVMFHFDNIAIRTERNVSINVEGLTQKNIAAKFDLSLRMRVREMDDTIVLEGVFFYNTDLFDATTIVRFAERLHTLLAAVVVQPDQRVWQLPLLSEQERELLVEWNNTQQEVTPPEQELYVQQLFEAQAARTPEAIALVAQGEVLSYAQLNQRANQLAQRLLDLGVGPEILVGLCLPGTPDLLIALLAVLKAGGAYVPLDPTYSAERLAHVLKDTRAAVLITRQGQSAAECNVHTIYLDADWPTIAQESTANPLQRVKGEHAAYVLSTSDAAETSRFVVVEQRQLLNYTQAISQRIGMTQGSSFALVQPLTTASAVTAIYPTLCAGGTLHMIASAHTNDARELSDYFQRHTIDYLNIAPTHLAALHSSALVRPVMPRRCLIVEGETSTWDWMRKLKTEHPACTIFNHYGSSESTVGVTTYLVEQEQDERSHSSTPIGRPLANTQAHILDSSLAPVPIYLPGELYIGGSNVARGYLYDPELTAEQFIDDPFSTEPDARLYKTGDLARYLPDGNIEFLGRTDDQIRIRGVWIEQGKVRAVLSQHPAVRFAMLKVREDVPGDRYLVAYVVLQEGQTVMSSELRKYVSQNLPIYMVPAAFVMLDTLPMTPHGRVDYQALPFPKSFREHARTHVAPQSEIELKLVQIWESLLQISPISVHDNFFDLGGNSLVAVRLMAKIQREFQQELPIAVLFQKATPEQLATELLRRRWSTTHAALVEIQPAGTKRPFFCVHPVGGEVFCYTELARQLGSEQPFYGFQVPRQSDKQISLQTIEEMACSYITEMQEVQPSGPYLLGGWSMGGVIAFEMAQQLVQQGHKVALLALFESYPPVGQPQNARALIQQFSEDLEGVFSQRLHVDSTLLQDLAPDEQLIQVYIHAKQADIIPPDLELEHLQNMFAIYRRNVEALRHYQPQTYADRLTLFTSSLIGNRPGDKTRGWQALATQELDVHIIPGNHYSILKKPNLYSLVELLKESLDKIG